MSTIMVSDLIELDATVQLLGTLVNQEKMVMDKLVGENFHSSPEGETKLEDIVKQLDDRGLVSSESRKKKGEHVKLYSITRKGEQVYSLMGTRNTVVEEMNQEIIETIKRGEFQ